MRGIALLRLACAGDEVGHEAPFVRLLRRLADHCIEQLCVLADEDAEAPLAYALEDDLGGVRAGEVGVELSRIVQEALTNARRHSGARSVEVRLKTEEETIVAEVVDDGRGFDPASPRAGVGLSTMRERVEALGGEIEVQSQLGEGTKVTVRVPLEGDTRAPRRL